MKTTDTEQAAIRRRIAENTAVRVALDHINSNRGRGDVVCVRHFASGDGEATRQVPFGRQSYFRFRAEFRAGSVKVYALGTSRVEPIGQDPTPALPDARYTAVKEHAGHASPVYVARFCGDCIGCATTETEAAAICHRHADARELALVAV